MARGIQMSSCVPVIWCLLVRKGSKFGRDKWVGGNLGAFKGLENCCASTSMAWWINLHHLGLSVQRPSAGKAAHEQV